MNTPSNVMAESPSAAIAPVDISRARRLYWLVARELWENRAVYLAPLAVAAIFLAGFFIGLVRLPDTMRTAMALPPMQQHEAIEQPFLFVALVVMLTEVLVAVFYCVDALYGERRDRSILFWKSLPVSDLTTVLSKASIPILVLPLVAFALTAVAQVVMLVASSAVLAGSGMDGTMVWTHVPFLKTSLMNLTHLVLIHGIWYAPLYGWLLLVSAWAKRVPFLWAALPPAAIGVVEKMAFNSSYVGAMLRDRLAGPDSGTAAHGMNMDMLAPSLAHFLTAPGLWIGLAMTALFLYLAVRLRRVRGLI
jgi:ABC-2 type transport system permease protein